MATSKKQDFVQVHDMSTNLNAAQYRLNIF